MRFSILLFNYVKILKVFKTYGFAIREWLRKTTFQTLFHPNVTLNERKVDVTSWSKYYDSGTDFHSLFNICFNMLALGRKELCNAVKYTIELF